MTETARPVATVDVQPLLDAQDGAAAERGTASDPRRLEDRSYRD